MNKYQEAKVPYASNRISKFETVRMILTTLLTLSLPFAFLLRFLGII